MAKKGNRQIYKATNHKTGTFYITTANRIKKVPKMLKKFDKKTKKHEEFELKKIK